MVRMEGQITSCFARLCTKRTAYPNMHDWKPAGPPPYTPLLLTMGGRPTQMLAARQACLGVLAASIHDGNALRVLLVGAAAGCAQLRAAARCYVVRHFTAVLEADARGLAALPQVEIEALLCDDALQVGSAQAGRACPC
jgi:hypothetical protein